MKVNRDAASAIQVVAPFIWRLSLENCG